MTDIDIYFDNDDDCRKKHKKIKNCEDDSDENAGQVDTSLESTNPLVFKHGFNIKEFLRLLNGKVDKVKGKGLSTYDYNDTDKDTVNTLRTYIPILSNLQNILSTFVLKTTKINGHSLTGDINLTPEDLGIVPLVQYIERFVADEGQSIFELQEIPSTIEKEIVHLNGLLVYPGTDLDYILNGKILTFNENLKKDEKIEIRYKV